MNAGMFAIDDKNIIVLGGVISMKKTWKLEDSDKVFMIELDYKDTSFMKTLT